MAIYHVVGDEWTGGDLLSLDKQYGEGPAIDIFCQRWPDADASLAIYHAMYVHCYATLGEAENDDCGGRILEIDDTDLAVEIDELEPHHPHPVVRDRIPAQYITVMQRAAS
jgi:hypothetical protein